MKKAVIWDLDGTLVNSIPVHFKRHQKLFKEEYSINLTKKFFEEECNGSQELEFYHTIMKHYLGNVKQVNAAMKKNHLPKYKADLSKIKVFPNVKPLLKKLKKEGYYMAVASSSHITYVKTILRNNDIIDYFDVVVSSSEVKHSKPNPDIFLHAQKKLNIPKKECIIIEDAANGVIAARRAGIDCLCLLTSETRDEVPKSAIIVPRHKGLYRAIKKAQTTR
ncbi:HAD family phosphatase [Candidatus Woesearchaeota archaeon]|nr:HAD family phosphatase [Candidatus Woesearchaeota archaeon]